MRDEFRYFTRGSVKRRSRWRRRMRRRRRGRVVRRWCGRRSLSRRSNWSGRGLGCRRRGRGEERQLRSACWRGFLSGNIGVARLPQRGSTTSFAKTNDASVGGADVSLNAAIVDFFLRIAGAAHDGEQAHFDFQRADGGEVDFPEIEMGIEEGHAIGMTAGFCANMADDADFGFFVFFRPTQNELLFGRKFVAGEDAGAIPAEEDRSGVLREDAPVQVTPDEEDGDFLRDASAAAHNLWWQGKGQRIGAGGPI